MVVPYTPPPAESAEGLVTRLAGRVKGATGWMRFLGVVYVIGGALGMLAIILLLIAGAVIDQFEGQLGQDIPAGLTGYLIAYLIVTVGFVALYIWLGVVLWQAADGIRDAHMQLSRRSPSWSAVLARFGSSSWRSESSPSSPSPSASSSS